MLGLFPGSVFCKLPCASVCGSGSQHHGRHPGPSAKGALCCYQVQTVLQEVPFLNTHREGCQVCRRWASLGKGHQLSSLRLPVLQPGPVITTQEGPAGHMHSVGEGEGGLTLISYRLYLPLHRSNLTLCALPASTEALLPLPQQPPL